MFEIHWRPTLVRDGLLVLVGLFDVSCPLASILRFTRVCAELIVKTLFGLNRMGNQLKRCEELDGAPLARRH